MTPQEIFLMSVLQTRLHNFYAFEFASQSALFFPPFKQEGLILPPFLLFTVKAEHEAIASGTNISARLFPLDRQNGKVKF